MIISVKQYFETYVQRCLGNLVKHKKGFPIIFRTMTLPYRSESVCNDTTRTHLLGTTRIDNS